MKYYLCILILLLNGCTALHIPQSELTLIEVPVEGKENTAGFSLNSGIWSKQIEPYAVRKHFTEGLSRQLSTRNLYGLSWTDLLAANQRTALGFSFGSGGIGMDLTQRFSQKVYVTVLGNVATNFEGIIQTPVYGTSKSGLTIGGFYRNERHGLIRDCSRYFCLGNEIGVRFRISAVGIRFSQYFYDSMARMRLRFSIGYSPEIKGIVLSAGVYSPRPIRKTKNRGNW